MANELRKSLLRQGPVFLLILVFSIFVNLLMLTGPLFMLQVYDRVLSSRSEATLVSLVLLIAGLFAVFGILDYARGRLAARVGAEMQTKLDSRVFSAVLNAPPFAGRLAATGLADLEAVQKFFASPVIFALFDVPWTPLFIAVIFTFHPMLGWLAVIGGVLLIAISLINQALSKKPGEEATKSAVTSARFAEQIRSQPDTIRGLGMGKSATTRWKSNRNSALAAQIAFSDRIGGFGSLTKSLRFFLQSAMLGLGAWLVLQNELTAGAMIAGSIILGRALAPIEQLIGGWAQVVRARQGWRSLAELLETVPAETPRMPIPRPKSRLIVAAVSAIPPGGDTPLLRQISFSLNPGQALGVIGESASGKSSLARVLTGVWQPAAGEVRLDGATLDQFDQETLGRLIGYLPQDVVLFEGTIAENIARLQENPDPKAIVEAAQLAGAHEMILMQPQGYDTRISDIGSRLSGGQKQRIGLARAIFGDPVLLILDEPNASLDSKGSIALNMAVRGMKEKGKSVIIMTHRPAAIAECDLILILENGQAWAFGPRDEVLRKFVQNSDQVEQNAKAAQ